MKIKLFRLPVIHIYSIIQNKFQLDIWSYLYINVMKKHKIVIDVTKKSKPNFLTNTKASLFKLPSSSLSSQWKYFVTFLSFIIIYSCLLLENIANFWSFGSQSCFCLLESWGFDLLLTFSVHFVLLNDIYGSNVP